MSDPTGHGFGKDEIKVIFMESGEGFHNSYRGGDVVIRDNYLVGYKNADNAKDLIDNLSNYLS